MFESDRGGVFTFRLQLIFFHLKCADAIVGVDQYALRGGQKTKAHLGGAACGFTLRKFGGHTRQHFVGILTDCSQPVLDAGKFRGDAFLIHVGADGPDFFRVVFALNRPAAGDGGDTLHLLILDQPVGDVDHHVADADDRDMFSHVERTVAETRQAIEVVHYVLGMEHALGGIPFNPDGFCPLRADGEGDGAGTQSAQIFNREVLTLPD